MIFKEPQATFLSNEMYINVQEFEQYLFSEFGDKASFFDMTVDFMLQDEANKAFENINIMEFSQVRKEFWGRFSGFLSSHDYEDCSVFDYCYELFNYFCSYYYGGLSTLFKDRSPGWNGPRIYLTNRISNEEQLIGLPNEITVYRGMSLTEYNSYSFGMSWSLDVEVAKRFAVNQSNTGIKTIVVQSSLKKCNVLYHDPSDHEKEIVVKNGLINNGKLVQ